MANIFVYKSRLWKEKELFTTPGRHQFTLTPGEYLMMCHGAKGGATVTSYQNLGGVSYGIMNLESSKTFHAYVGGDGGSSGSTGFDNGIGGFNGGGNGGKASSTSNQSGAGGGGASDIRLKTPEEIDQNAYCPTLPNGYKRIDFINIDGVYFDTNYIANENTTFTASVSFMQPKTILDYVLLGAQSAEHRNPGWAVYLNNKYNSEPSIGSIYGNMGWDSGAHMVPTTIPFGQKATYRIDKFGTFVNEKPLYYKSDITGSPQSDQSVWFCANKRNGGLADAIFAGNVYFLRIYEMENNEYVLKHEYIPAIRESDNAVGLCDTVIDSQTIFLEPILNDQQTSKIFAGPISYDPIDPIALTKRYYPTISAEYQQIEYIQTPGDIYFDSGYIANENTSFTFRAMATNSTSGRTMFGAQSGDNVDPGWACFYYYDSSIMKLASIYGDMSWDNGAYLYDTKTKLNTAMFYRVEKSRTFSAVKQLMDYEPGGTPDPDKTILILDCRRGNDGYPSSNSSFIGRLYHFRIYEKDINGDDILVHEFVPCQRVTDDVIGLYDTVEQPDHTHIFLEMTRRTGSNDLTAGPSGSFAIVDYDGLPITNTVSEIIYGSLNTRIMVAGGGGGCATWTGSRDRRIYAGIGGGVYGGYMELQYGGTDRPYSSQDDGASFGFGQSGRNGTSGTYGQNGSSGGGGGWFGGYASTVAGNSTNAAGGGGSGFVLTNTSYIPNDYMEDYEPYEFTNVFMGAGYAESSCIRICELCETIHAGDVITIYGFGTVESFPLSPGEYILKCWGGDGGCVSDPESYIAKGGYAQGTLNLPSSSMMYAYVGGSGMYYDLLTYEYVHIMRPDIGFNGGGLSVGYGNDATSVSNNGAPGGGGTDIRIGSESLYARVIVAGGSGGSNANSNTPYRGGIGGGSEGGYGTMHDSRGQGNSPGPGTQTGSPTFPSVNINGGFGYGGNSYPSGGNRSAGAGGGGWFGGSSSFYSNSGYDIIPSNGGSGYVFTSDSYKPDGMLLDSDYYLTNTTLTSGGNNLPIGISKIEIDVISTKTVRILCRDAYGIKYYDESQSRWVWLEGVSEPTVDTFIEYGSMMMESDNGLANEYDVLVYDPDDSAGSMSLNVVPNTQHIETETTTDAKVTKITPKLEFDQNVFDINIVTTRQTLVSGTKIKTSIDVTKKTADDKKAKIYYVTYTDDR